MNCSDVKLILWDYYDEACPPSQRQALETHLSSCPDCRASLDEWIAISHAAFRTQNVQAPAFLWTRVLAGIESREQKPGIAWWSQWQWMSRFAMATALLVSLGVGVVYYQAVRDEVAMLDDVLQGGEKPAQVIHLASAPAKNSDQVTVAWLLGGSAWEQK